MRPRTRKALGWIAALVIVAAIAAGWGWSEHRREAVAQANATTGGRASHAIQVMIDNGCAGCHTISGVPGAQGHVGPRLDASLAKRSVIAGRLPNTPANLIHWVRAAREINPHTVMPSTGITEAEARDVAAYLYGLK